MSADSLALRYLRAMSSADGATASELFTPDGTLDDYRGGHRVGRQVIRDFIDARPPRTIDLLSDIVAQGDRLTVYTQMDYADGRSKTVRFIFTTVDGLVGHLCNSEIEFVPPELVRTAVRLEPCDPAGNWP